MFATIITSTTHMINILKKNKMKQWYQKIQTYWSFFDKRNCILSLGLSYFLTWSLFDQSQAELMLWLIQWIVYPLVLSFLTTLILPKLIEFWKEGHYKNIEWQDRLDRWMTLISAMLGIYIFHATSFCLYYLLSVKIIAYYFNLFEFRSFYLLFLLVPNFFFWSFLHCMSLYAFFRMRYYFLLEKNGLLVN